MNLVDDMDAAHRQAMADRQTMHDLRETLRGFLKNAPPGARQATLDACKAADLAIDRDVAHMVRVWD
jgi:hypothetical protein